MAKTSRTAEERMYWTGVAERWIACAETTERTERQRAEGAPQKRKRLRERDPVRRLRSGTTAMKQKRDVACLLQYRATGRRPFLAAWSFNFQEAIGGPYFS